jgi:NADPH-dependent glutamate synthase beta subunit-like oxidoreductase
VINLELMDQPPAERAASNRWPFWPRVFRVDYGHAEAKHAFGDDPRRYCVLSKRFIKGDDGAVTVRAPAASCSPRPACNGSGRKQHSQQPVTYRYGRLRKSELYNLDDRKLALARH